MTVRSIIWLATAYLLAACGGAKGVAPDTGGEEDDDDTDVPPMDCTTPFDDSAWPDSPTFNDDVTFRTTEANFSCQSGSPTFEVIDVNRLSFQIPELLVFENGNFITLTLAEAQAINEQAMGIWDGIAGITLDLSFNDSDTHVGHNGISNVEIRKGAGPCADTLASTEFPPATATNSEADIRIYTSTIDCLGFEEAIIWTPTSGQNEYSLTDVITHELGHAIGFQENTNASSIMFEEINPGDLKFLTSQDEDGARFIYN